MSIFTYCGSVTFGITGDYDSTPDLEVLARGIEDGISELLAATGNGAPPQTAAS
ncbi:MAG: WS/DGAT domain-containing protein [Streptosporangiaceae bacterium]